MSKELGDWLRQQREARGWPRPEMARQLIKAAQARGDTSTPGTDSMCHNIYRWERGAGGLSDRYKLHYCHALGIAPGQFGPGQPDSRPTAAQTPRTIIMATAAGLPAVPSLAQAPYVAPGPADPRLLVPAAVAYRGIYEPDMGDSTVQREVLMAAHEGSEHAEHAEQRGIGDTTLEQLRADVVWLSREYMTGEPFPLFLEMRRVRGRMHDALDRRTWPRDATELYLLLGCLNGLMAGAADDLGYPQAAEELLRAGWAYAIAIDHRPLMAKLRLDLASLAYWNGRPREAADLASSGLEYLSSGPTAVQLHLKYGRAVAGLGDADSARQAITEAGEARESEYRDDLTEIGGEFDLSAASQRYLTGSVLVEIPAAASDAATELERATELYAAGPGSDETHGYGMEALARINLAEARLRAGAIEAASDALGAVFSLPIGKRIDPIPQRLGRVRAELAQPIFRGSQQARELGERIEEFGREAITTGLHSLPGGPG
jgi:hypothetical protein